MNLLVPIALFGCIPLVLWLFKVMPPQRAVITAFVAAWLFLPVVHEPVLGLRWTKMRATCYGILLASMIYDSGRFRQIEWSWRDLPIAVWCFCPFLSSMANGLGLYDGLSQTLDQVITWGLPYTIGRAYLGSFDGIKELAVGIVLGGLAYVPFCLVEIRLSPQCHTWVYGYFQHSFTQTIRFGGFRPVVFMEHGLAVGVWMTSATLTSLWLWRSGTLTGISVGSYRLPIACVVAVIGVTTVLCKSSGALALGAAGAVVLYLTAWGKTRAILILLMLLPVGYVFGRVSGSWSGMEFADWIAANFDKERSASFVFRLDNENLLISRALESPVFGWGGWGRARVYDQDGTDLTVTDGLWIITLGDRGFLGLVALGLTIVAPAIWTMARYDPAQWTDPRLAPAAVLTINLILFLIDGLANDMKNPVFLLAGGALNGLAAGLSDRKAQLAKPQSSPRLAVRATLKYPRSQIQPETIGALK